MSQPGGSHGEGLPYAARTVPSEPDASQSTPETAELLDKVVRETLSTCCASDDVFDATDIERLREVARRHAGAPLTVDPVATELVHVVLEGMMGGNLADVCRSAATQIAQTLLDDPGTKAKLERFWMRLSGGAS